MAEGSCSYMDCQAGTFDSNSTRIEVSTVLPGKEIKKVKSQFKVAWSKDGEARFHKECWGMLLKSARCRNQKKAAIVLMNTEREMIKEANKTAEQHDSTESIKSQAKKVARMIRTAEYCCCFTGAGISTSAGIGDYRGKSGKWTEMDRGQLDMDSVARAEKDVTMDTRSPNVKRRRLSSAGAKSEDEDEGEMDEEGVHYDKLRPTYTHEALVKLMDLGHLKYVISQNGDGLHTLSGIPQDKISELHGNVFQEKCEKCGTVYDRAYYTMDDAASQYYEELEDEGKTDIIKPKHAKQCELCGLSHRTGRRCKKKGCKGMLMDTIINFRDNLEERILNRAYREAEKSDMMLCLGTTLQVSPANSIVEMGKEPLGLVIINRQKTDIDKLCTEKDRGTGEPNGARIFGDCDEVMRLVMRDLLDKRDLRSWEEGRDDRMKVYDTKRQ